MTSSRYSIGSWLCSLLALLLLPVVALAADPTAAAVVTGPSLLDPATAELARVLGALAALLVSALGTWLFALIREKLKIDIGAASEQARQDLATRVGLEVEERAAAALKERTGPNAKLSDAAAKLRALCPGMTQAEAEARILAAIPTVGAGASSYVPAEPIAQE